MAAVRPDLTPSRRAAVFLLSAAMLGFQVLQVVVLSLA